jgi:formylglycine-generating enzyme required for sulfatase activity
MHPTTLGLALAAALAIPAAASSVVIDWVTIGDPGNAAQSAANRTHSFGSGGDGFGAVDYAYRIARNETTISDYAKFLNAVAATDTYGLYNTNMSWNTELGSLITRSGSPGSYTYSVPSGRENLPVAYVSWFDAARFANWMHNGQPTGAQNASTTEDGAYTLNGATSGIITKNVGATVWIPTENEWFKAAYYDPTHMSGAGGYWLHANQSNSMTANTIGAPGAANYYDGDYVGSGTSSLPSGNALTDVGAYAPESQSYYGLNDMAGNLWEWNDAVIGSSRVRRGGSWVDQVESNLRSSVRDGVNPSIEPYQIGFRLASIPEPSTTLLTLVFTTGLLCRRRRNA